MNAKSKYSTSSLIDMYRSLKEYYGLPHADEWVRLYLTDEEKKRLADALAKNMVRNWSIVALG